jgi:hypothetical protein
MQKQVVSSARKLIFRPAANAPTVSFPPKAKINDYGINNASPSVIVLNGTEAELSWQGVDYATGVVIVNEVAEPLAEAAMAKLAHDPSPDVRLFAVTALGKMKARNSKPALEAALPTRSSETEGLALRVQSLESTLSAFAKTVADLPRQVTTKEKAGT